MLCFSQYSGNAPADRGDNLHGCCGRFSQDRCIAELIRSSPIPIGQNRNGQDRRAHGRPYGMHRLACAKRCGGYDEYGVRAETRDRAPVQNRIAYELNRAPDGLELLDVERPEKRIIRNNENTGWHTVWLLSV